MRAFAAVVLVLAVGLGGCGDDDRATDDTTAGEPQPVELFFVLSGRATVRGDELEVIASDVDWFTASPARRAGTESLDRFLTRWKREFGREAPNAAMSGPNGLDAELTLHTATGVADGVRFKTSILRGAVPPGELGDVTLFVDPADDTVPSTGLVTFDETASFPVRMTCGGRVVDAEVAIEGAAAETSPASSTLSVRQTSGPFQLTTSSIDSVETEGGMVEVGGSAEFACFDSTEMTAAFALTVPVDGEGKLWSSLDVGSLVLSVQAQGDPLLVAIASIQIGTVR